MFYNSIKTLVYLKVLRQCKNLNAILPVPRSFLFQLHTSQLANKPLVVGPFMSHLSKQNLHKMSNNIFGKRKVDEIQEDSNDHKDNIKKLSVEQNETVDSPSQTISDSVVESESFIKQEFKMEPENENDQKSQISASNQEHNKKYRPKKYAILLSYSGVGYFGLQRNNPYKTIEEEILKVWLKMNLILPEQYEKPQQIFFQRAARTDKGVSAAKQILTCRLPEELSERLDEMNSLLPPEIKIFAAKRTTKFFDSRTYCDGRTYSYMLPTFALAPPDQLISSFYRAHPKLIDEFNVILQNYKGTHNFHNFTSGKKATDASAMRFMIEISCSNPFQIEDMEFAIVRIKGQSFMLHQIRKMIGLAIAVMRGMTGQETIHKAFEDEKIDIPIAPGLGLMLEEVHYDRYNLRYGGDGIHEPIEWSELNEKIELFKREKILPNVYQGEKKEYSMMKWLQSLPIHTYGARDQDKSSEQHQNQIKEALAKTELLIENEVKLQAKNQQTLDELVEPDEKILDQNETNNLKVQIECKSTKQDVVDENAYFKAYLNADIAKKTICDQ